MGISKTEIKESPGAKTYPLTSSQMLIFFAWKWSFHKQVMNVATSVFADTPLDPEMLKKAAGIAVGRNDAFGIRITKKGKERAQYFTDRRVLVLDSVDFSGKTEADMDAFFHRDAATPFRLYDRPLARIHIVRSPEGKSGVYMCTSHLILDSWSISVFYKDLMAVYAALEKNLPMPSPLRSCEATIQKDLEYKSSERYKKDLAFWTKEMTEPEVPPIATHINGSAVLKRWRRLMRKPDHPYMKGVSVRTTASHEVIIVPKEDIDRMKEYCLKNSLPTMYQLFLMGVRTYLARVNDRPKSVTLYNTVARRGTIEEKMSGGTRIHMLYYTTVMDETITFRDAVELLFQKQNEIYRHADFNPLDNFNIMYDKMGMRPGEDFSAMSVTFQPLPMELESGMKISTKWYCNGAAGTILYLTIMDYDGTGALRCYYEYQNKIVRPERIRECHNYAMKVIRAGIANPDITLGELLDLAGS